MGQIHLEASLTVQSAYQRSGLVLLDFPGAATAPAIEMSVLGLGKNVEFLPTIDAMAMSHEADLLQDVERPVDGRWGRLRIELPAALQQLPGGHMTGPIPENLQHEPALWRGAHAAGAELAARRVPLISHKPSFALFALECNCNKVQ
jgi:hypothetical protein